MNNIWKESLEAVRNGAHFCINLQKRSLRIGKKDIIKDGKFKGELGFGDESKFDLLDAIDDAMSTEEIIEVLYANYKFSVPSERSDSRRRLYFFALPYDDLSDEDLCTGEPRELAQYKLEAFLLFSVLTGKLDWEMLAADSRHWFWKGFDRDLVILRTWICGAA